MVLLHAVAQRMFFWIGEPTAEPFQLFGYVAGILLVSVVLIALLLIKQQWIERFPPPVYIMAVMACLLALDTLTGDGNNIWPYLLCQGIVSVRLSGEKTGWTTLSFLLSYLMISGLNGWRAQPWWLLIYQALAFGMIGWMSSMLQKARWEALQVKQENRRLLVKVEEANRRLHEYILELEETSRRDYLTGLYNFSGFQEQVTRSLARCGAGQSYHVICVDLVDFQQVNMREGIDAGDQMLVMLARQLKRNLPPYAQVARYDGDQFAVGLMGDERVLRQSLETIEEVISGLRAGRTLLNFCLGTASYPQEATNASELIRIAENRLSIEQSRLRHQEEERQRHLEKLSALGQLAAGLAHEIRNPLTSIRGFIQISARESEQVKKWESIILPEIDRINDLLRQFLHLSESRPARFTVFNLDQLMEDVLRLLQPKTMLMGHQLIVQPPVTPVVIEADAEQLKQVLINLIQNGLESLSEGGKVTVRWKEMRDRILIRVEDNGSGIKPEHMSRIFDPFFTTKKDGTGMGLSICHRIISDHGGQIHVTSQPGRGTTFNIHLPICQVSTVKQRSSTNNQDHSGTSQQGTRNDQAEHLEESPLPLSKRRLALHPFKLLR
jgi:diguanylate cyclase (GGDEF)-like protein